MILTICARRKNEKRVPGKNLGRLNSLVDTFLILMCIAIAIFAGNQVFNTSYIPPIMGGERITLGQVDQLVNDVRRRSFDNFSWHDLGSNEVLYHNDRIFTDKNSTAQLKFSSGNSIKVSEESLFKITQDTDGINLNIEQGIVFATLNNANEAFIVKVGDQIYEIKSDKSNIKISNANGNKELSVLSGEAKVKLGDHEETIEKGTRVLLTNETYSIKQSWPSEFSPADGSVFYLIPKNKVEFKFKENVTKLFLSKTRSAFSNGEAHIVKGNILTLNDLEEGTYHWQVSEGQEVSSEKSFEVIYEKVPEFQNLDIRESVILLGRTKEVFTEEFDEIEVRVNGEDYEKFDYKDGKLELSFDKVGTYKVMYRNKSQEHPFAIYSNESIIKVVESPSEIDLKRPFNGEEYYFYTKGEIHFNWKTQDLFEDVRTFIVINGKRTPVVGTSYRYLVDESGDFEWSLEYVLNDEIISESKKNKFTVTFDKDNSKLEEGRKIVVKKPGDVIDLTWQNKTNGDGNFIVEIARDRSFGEIKEVITAKSNNTKLLVKELGVHYWRVKNESNQFVPPVKIIVVPPPPPPKPVIKKIEKRVEIKKKSILYTFLSFFISDAYASNGVELKWEAINDVKEYRVQIFDGDKLIVDDKTSDNKYMWADYSTGHFQWQVAAIDYWNQESPFSEREDLIITKKFGGAKGISLISPSHGQKFLEDDVIELKFSHVSGDKFFIELSKDKYFTEIKEIPIGKSLSYKLRNKLGDSFYWRVKASEAGDFIYSNKRRVEVMRPQNRSEKSVNEKKKANWFVGVMPELLTYEVISGGKILKVDDPNFISFIGGLNFEIKNIHGQLTLKHSSGLVFEDQPFNRTRIELSSLKRRGKLSYGSIIKGEYRSELELVNTEIKSEASFYFNFAPSFSYDFGQFDLSASYFILNYSGISADIDYKINPSYQVGVHYESFDNSDLSSKTQSISLKAQLSF